MPKIRNLFKKTFFLGIFGIVVEKISVQTKNSNPMKTLISLLSFFLILGLVTGCDLNSDPNSAEARVNFRLVDAPANYDEVWIEVLAIRVKVDHEGSEANEDESTWDELPNSGPTLVNLLDLTGGNSLLIGSEDFPEGKIDQIRLILGENNYLMKDGTKINLTTPSAQQSGLKVKVGQSIEGGNTYDLVIDFDAAKSIVTAGNSGNVILKPVLRAYLDITQGIQGQVLPLEAQPVLVTVSGNGIEVNTFADETGKYSVLGLAPGNYTVTFTPNEGYQGQSIQNVSVIDDQITTVNVVNLAIKP
jgi:predicted RecA/RadA family phage recombinase